MRLPQPAPEGDDSGGHRLSSSDWQARLAEGALGMDIRLTRVQLAAFESYLSILLDWNRRLNLTAVTAPGEIAALHFLDSLTGLAAVQFDANTCVIDVGAGAGFPGIPLAIARPDLEITLLESTGKKCRFLEHAIGELALARVSVDCRRAELAGKDPAMREAFDIAVTRAVAEVAVASELCLPFVKRGGLALMMKGPRGDAEVARAKVAIETLGGQMVLMRHLTLPTPTGSAERVIVGVRKTDPTPGRYPRGPGIPAKRPLGIDRRPAPG